MDAGLVGAEGAQLVEIAENAVGLDGRHAQLSPLAIQRFHDLCHNASMIADRKAFIRANTRLKPVPHVPEISLHVADEAVPIWQKTEEELDAIGLPPPYWAFAWAGGQALARYRARQPRSGRRPARARSRGRLRAGGDRGRTGRRRAGDRRRHRRVHRSRRSRSMPRRTTSTSRSSPQDLLDRPAPPAPRYDVILVGDLFYERDTAARALAFLDRHAATGARVLIGDPGPHLSAEGPPHAARRVFGAGDARAGGPGDQADERVGADMPVIPRRRSS